MSRTHTRLDLPAVSILSFRSVSKLKATNDTKTTRSFEWAPYLDPEWAVGPLSPWLLFTGDWRETMGAAASRSGRAEREGWGGGGGGKHCAPSTLHLITCLCLEHSGHHAAWQNNSIILNDYVSVLEHNRALHHVNWTHSKHSLLVVWTTHFTLSRSCVFTAKTKSWS